MEKSDTPVEHTEHETSAHKPEHKPTKKEIEQLAREVQMQNRKLISVCIVVLVLAVAIFFGFKAIGQHINQPPAQWTYENALLDVYKGNINENQYPYTGYIFARPNNESLWTFQGRINGSVYEITTYYAPKELEDIDLSDLAIAQIISKPQIVITLNSSLDNVDGGGANGGIAAIELGKILGTKNNILDKYVVATVTEAYPNMSYPGPVTCANATSYTGVIQIELANQTALIARPHCILLLGSSPPQLIRAADRLLYGMLGIMSLSKQALPGSNQTNSTTTNGLNNNATGNAPIYVNTTASTSAAPEQNQTLS